MSTNNETFQAVPLDEFILDDKTNSFQVDTNEGENEFMNGKYQVKQSSCLDDQGIGRASHYSATNLFDGRNSTFWQTPYIKSSKSGYQDGYTKNAYKNGKYVGGGKDKYHKTMLTDGTTLDGEWAEIKLPYKLILTDYFLQIPISPKKYAKRFPLEFTVLGSNDGNKWVVIDKRNDEKVLVGRDMELPIEFTVKNNMFSYSYYRLVISKLFENKENNSISLSEWSLFGKRCMNLEGECNGFISDSTEPIEGMSMMDSTIHLHSAINDFNEQYMKYIECNDNTLNPANSVLNCSKQDMNKNSVMDKYKKIVSYDKDNNIDGGLIYTMYNVDFNQATSPDVFDASHNEITDMYGDDIHTLRNDIQIKMDYINNKKNSVASDINNAYQYNQMGTVALTILATTTLYYVFFKLNK